MTVVVVKNVTAINQRPISHLLTISDLKCMPMSEDRDIVSYLLTLDPINGYHRSIKFYLNMVKTPGTAKTGGIIIIFEA